jgi:hypothetical protein
MSFTDAEKTDIRRFAGYPAYGGTPSSFQSWRFFQAYGLLEYRLSNLSTAEEAVVRTTYLANLQTLETDIFGARTNLDTDKAAVWTHNKNELGDRGNLFNYWRSGLCEFIGVPLGPGLADAGTHRTVV